MANQWVKVEFYGQMPEGQGLKTFDLTDYGKLMDVFGFEKLDALTVGTDVEGDSVFID